MIMRCWQHNKIIRQYDDEITIRQWDNTKQWQDDY